MRNEYRILKSREREIRQDARIVYFSRLNENNKGKPLYNICCDFKALEIAAQNWVNDKLDSSEKVLVGSANAT